MIDDGFDRDCSPTVMPRQSVLAANMRDSLKELGVDFTDHNFRDTPDRWAKWIMEYTVHNGTTIEDILRPVFPEDHHELVMVRDVEFVSLCAHHLLPFRGTAAVGYVPNEHGQVVGISKLARALQFYAKRFTLQERITTQLADGLMRVLAPKGAMVVIRAEHQCMTIRGVRTHESSTVTSAVRGIFEENYRGCRDEFLKLAGIG